MFFFFQISVYIRSKYKLCDDINDCIIKLQNESKLAVAVSRYHIAAYHSAEKFDFFCFSKGNSVSTFPVSIITTHNFHLLPKMNYIIGHMSEHGHIIKWVRDQYSGSLWKKIRERRYFAKNFGVASEKRIITLTLTHISGAMAILYIGSATAFFVFILELLIGKRMQSLSNQYQQKKCVQLRVFSIFEKFISVDCMFHKLKNK